MKEKVLTRDEVKKEIDMSIDNGIDGTVVFCIDLVIAGLAVKALTSSKVLVSTLASGKAVVSGALLANPALYMTIPLFALGCTYIYTGRKEAKSLKAKNRDYSDDEIFKLED